jgi:hypothetical protein
LIVPLITVSLGSLAANDATFREKNETKQSEAKEATDSVSLGLMVSEILEQHLLSCQEKS